MKNQLLKRCLIFITSFIWTRNDSNNKPSVGNKNASSESVFAYAKGIFIITASKRLLVKDLADVINVGFGRFFGNIALSL